jgi:hypothetical protein
VNCRPAWSPRPRRPDALWLGRLSQQGGIAHLLRTRKALAAGTIAALLARLGRAYRRLPADVVHANWLQNALPLWGTTTPALVTVLGSDFGLLRLPGMKAFLRAVLRQRRAILAPNADWMRPGLEQAFGDLAEIRPIAFGVDDAWFDVVRHPSAGDTRHWLAVTRLTHHKIGDLFSLGRGAFRRYAAAAPVRSDAGDARASLLGALPRPDASGGLAGKLVPPGLRADHPEPPRRRAGRR